MIDFIISNDRIEAKVSSVGAQLISLIIDGTQTIWEGDDVWWGKSSPILFPNIGFLKDDKFCFKGTTYYLPKHGLLRNSSLKCTIHLDTAIAFEFNTRDLEVDYPFNFTVTITFKVDTNLSINYNIKNNSSEAGYFSIGSHPAFKLFSNTALDEYKIYFNTEVEGPFYLEDGLVNLSPTAEKFKELTLKRNMFCKDALIFRAEGLIRVCLVHTLSNRRIVVGDISGCSYFALWAPVGAPFICLEPWVGVPDSIDSNNEILTKQSVTCLQGGEVFCTNLSIDCS